MLPLTRGSARALVAEASRARHEDGLDVRIVWADNGSTDGTQAFLRSLSTSEVPSDCLFQDRNLGNAVGRNRVIDHLLWSGAEYWLSVDGDVEIVPGSLTAFLREMERRGEGCFTVAAHDLAGIPDPALATPYYREVVSPLPHSVNLYTNYALFRVSHLECGLRFSEHPAFVGPGWGFEDCELACQVFARGLDCVYVDDIRFLHRHINSSVAVMKTSGLDPNALWRARQQALVDLWGSHPDPKVMAVVAWAISQNPEF